MRFPAIYSFPTIGSRTWALRPWDERLLEMGNYSLMRTMAHMSMHVHQPRIFGTHGHIDNSHLDNKEARILIQLEINALIHAFKNIDDNRYSSIRDALSIRAERRRLFPDAAMSENVFEVHEGLVDYTDIRIVQLGFYEKVEHFEWSASRLRYDTSLSRMFGYVSGALYGFLLDNTGATWRNDVQYGVDLGAMLIERMDLADIPAFADVDLDLYGYTKIMSFEEERYKAHGQMLDDLFDAFTTQTLLHIPTAFERGGMQLNPSRIFSISGLGVAYGGPTVVVSGDFGRLVVYDGFFVRLIGGRNGSVVATDMTIEDNRYSAHGWFLELNDGFVVRSRPDGHYVVSRA